MQPIDNLLLSSVFLMDLNKRILHQTMMHNRRSMIAPNGQSFCRCKETRIDKRIYQPEENKEGKLTSRK